MQLLFSLFSQTLLKFEPKTSLKCEKGATILQKINGAYNYIALTWPYVHENVYIQV